jgi:hypothetical protein
MVLLNQHIAGTPMKHTGGCHCGQVTFETDLEPMLIAQCNCQSCRTITGSFNLGAMYAVDEIKITGETDSYTYEGGSGYDNIASFCKNCHVRVTVHNTVMEGMIGIPLGTFKEAKSLSPKLEIWTSEKLGFLKTSDCIVESFEDSGIAERLGALLEAMDNR